MTKFQTILFYRKLYYRPPWHTGRLVSTRVKFYRPFVCARASVYPACVCARVFVYLACVCARLSAWVLGACVTVCVCVCVWLSLDQSLSLYVSTDPSGFRVKGGRWWNHCDWPMRSKNGVETNGCNQWHAWVALETTQISYFIGENVKNILLIKFFKFTISKD